MKLRKVLAGALALVMAVGTILVAPVESKAANVDSSVVYDPYGVVISDTEETIVKEKTYQLSANVIGNKLVDATGVWNTGGGDQYLLSGDFDVTIRFYNDAFCGGTDNWHNFIFEIFGGADTTGLTLRSDAFGWTYGEGTNVPTFTNTRSWGDEWTGFAAASDEQFVTLNLKKTSDTVVTADILFEGSQATEQYVVTYPNGVPSEMRVQVGGECAKVYVCKFVDNTSSASVSDPVVTWTSSNPDVATVDANGLVTAIAAGEATITASSGDVDATCAIVVTNGENLITGIEIEADKTEVKVGNTAQITADVKLQDANAVVTDSVTTITYKSSDEKVVTVDKDGKVTAVAPGKATITATVGQNNYSDTVEITVPAVPATKLEASVEKTELNAGDSVQIKATVAPTDTTDVITYESSNGAVLVVDANGKVSAVKAGTATVTVKAGSLTKTFNFAVNETSTMELDDMSIEGWWTAHTPGIAIEAGKTYTFTFDAKSKAATEAYFCPSYVVYSNSAAAVQNDSADYKEYYVCRADNFSWSPAGNSFDGKLGDGYVLETNAIPETTDWLATYKENMAAGAKATITAVLSGSNLIVVYDVAGVKTTSTIPVDASKPLYIGLTGEQVDVTNLVVTSQTAIKATADILPVLPIVMLIVGCGVVVVASKKRFAK